MLPATAFFTGKNDAAHISFVKEANEWFQQESRSGHFLYDTTSDWSNMNDSFLSTFDVVLFLDTRPETEPQRMAFERFMKLGGGWMGFHFSAFALTPSAYPQNWNLYHESFLGTGSYVSNTWRPTSAVLVKSDSTIFQLADIPTQFRSAPNEWYRWEHDLRQNDSIRILFAIHPSSFPLGTGPKPHEIWHTGFYPVVWTNIRYNMVYLNMGHNDIDYEGATCKTLSRTFSNATQAQLVRSLLKQVGDKAMRRRL